MNVLKMSGSADQTNAFYRRLPWLTLALCCFGSTFAAAQTVTFSGASIALPSSGIESPAGLAINSAGDIFLAEPSLNVVAVMRHTPTGYATPTTLPLNGLNSPSGIALDSAGNVFVADTGNNRVVELLNSEFNLQFPLPFSSLSSPYGIAVDASGNVFVTEPFLNAVVELPRTANGYRDQTTLSISGLSNPYGIALDREGDLFLADTGNSRIVEVPNNGAAFGPQITLPFNSLSLPYQLGVSLGGDLFVSDTYNRRVVKLSKTTTGYGSEIILPAGYLDGHLIYPEGIVPDTSGNVFIADTSYNRVVKLQTRSVDFGHVNACAPEQTEPAPCIQTLALSFRMKTDVTLGTPLILNGKTQDFSFSSGTCTGELKEGAACFAAVSFIPKKAGPHQGSIEIRDAGGAVVSTVPLTGLGIGLADVPPAPHFSTTYMQFGEVLSGNAKDLPLTISNLGGGVLPILPSINGRSFKVAGSTCGLGLAAGESCVLQVEFAPISVANHHNKLMLKSPDAAYPVVFLEGIAPGLGVSTRQLKFGEIPSGTTKVLPLTVTNYAQPGAIHVSAYARGGSGGAPYVVLTTAQNTCTAGISYGQSCTLPVAFEPGGSKGPGVHNGDLLNIRAAESSATAQVFLEGSSTGIVVEQHRLLFGGVPHGSAKVSLLTVTNVGVPGSIHLSTSISGYTPAAFTVLNNSQNTCLAGITAGQSCTLPVQFLPPLSGKYYADMAVKSPGLETFYISLSGSGIGHNQ